MSKNNDDQNLFNQMNLGGFGGLRRKAQVEINSEIPFEKALTKMGKTLDELLKIGNLSELNKLERNILINSVNQVYVPLSNLVVKLKNNEVCEFDIDANKILEEINKTKNLHKSEFPEIGSNIVALASVVLAGVDLKGLEEKTVAQVLKLAKSLNNIVVEHFFKQNKQQNNEQPEHKEISTKDEAVRLLNWAEKYSEPFYDTLNPTLAIQCVAGAVECAIMTIAKHNFNFNYYIEGVGIHEKFLNSYKQEIMRTVEFLKNYGRNAEAMFNIAMHEDNDLLISRIFRNVEMFNLIHSAGECELEDYDNIIKMGGMYARYRIAAIFQLYEQKFAKKHMELFMDVLNPDNAGNPRNQQVFDEHGIHFKNIGLIFGKMMEIGGEVATEKNIDMDFSVNILNFMKDKCKALIVKKDNVEVATTDWFNLRAEKNHEQQLIEPIYDYKGETEFFFISPVPFMDWRNPNIFTINKILDNNQNLFTGKVTGHVLARAMIPQF